MRGMNVKDDLRKENSKRPALNAVARDDHSLLSQPLLSPTPLLVLDDTKEEVTAFILPF